jgi:hypothetical protein
LPTRRSRVAEAAPRISGASSPVDSSGERLTDRRTPLYRPRTSDSQCPRALGKVGGFFCGKDGTDTAPTGVREAFYRVCLAAGLSQKRPAAERQVAAGTIGKPTATERLVPRFTPHGLRHTYAALHLQHGTDVYYVSRQLGHADIALTVGTYGAWLRPNRRAAVDALDRIAAETPSEALA